MKSLQILFMVTLIKVIWGQEDECPDPNQHIVDMYATACDTDNCAENADRCMESMKAPIRMCDAMDACKDEIKERMMGQGARMVPRPMMPPSPGAMFKEMQECMYGKIGESLNITMSDDDSENMKMYIDAIIAIKPDLDEDMVMALQSVKSDMTCLMDDDDSDMMDSDSDEDDSMMPMMMSDIKKRLCCLRICVNALNNN